MKKTVFILSTLLFVGQAYAEEGKTFSVSSYTFENGKALPKKMEFNGFGCNGENISPQLNIENAPEGTKSFAITIHDPDAPTTSGWWHWLVYNIPANSTKIEEGASITAKNTLPKGAIEATTDYGSQGFGGACPPEGHIQHHYNLTVYALKVEKLDLDPKNTFGAKLTYMLNANSLGKATLQGLYKR
jgi:hypothetical protein